MWSDYSAIAHYAMNTGYSERCSDVLFVMLTAFSDTGMTAAFDASGHESDQPVMVVAGFVSSAKDWIEFDKAWRQRLAKDNLTYFHMVEFAHCINDFKQYKKDEPKRQRLFNDLIDIIKRHVYRKFAQAVVHKTFIMYPHFKSKNQPQ